MHIRGKKKKTKTIFLFFLFFFWKGPKFRSEESVNQEIKKKGLIKDACDIFYLELLFYICLSKYKPYWAYVYSSTYSMLNKDCLCLYTEWQKSCTTKRILIFRIWKYINSLQVMWNETMLISTSIFKRERRKKSNKWSIWQMKMWTWDQTESANALTRKIL